MAARRRRRHPLQAGRRWWSPRTPGGAATAKRAWCGCCPAGWSRAWAASGARPAAAIIDAVAAALEVAGIHPAALRGLASVVAKADEPGLQEAAEELGVSLSIALDDDVQLQIAAHSLAESAWVRDHIGVGAACEPAALWAAGPGARLVLPKQAANGITVALAMVEGGDVIAQRTSAGGHPAGPGDLPGTGGGHPADAADRGRGSRPA